jgi:hypothetical protein
MKTGRLDKGTPARLLGLVAMLLALISAGCESTGSSQSLPAAGGKDDRPGWSEVQQGCLGQQGLDCWVGQSFVVRHFELGRGCQFQSFSFESADACFEASTQYRLCMDSTCQAAAGSYEGGRRNVSQLCRRRNVLRGELRQT